MENPAENSTRDGHGGGARAAPGELRRLRADAPVVFGHGEKGMSEGKGRRQAPRTARESFAAPAGGVGEEEEGVESVLHEERENTEKQGRREMGVRRTRCVPTHMVAVAVKDDSATEEYRP